jgi:hypothetical protein
LTGHLTLRHAPRLAERALRAAGRTLPEGLGLLVSTPGGVAYHAFVPQSLVYETDPEAAHCLGHHGFAQYCAGTKEAVRWEVNRGQLDRIWFWKPIRETYVMDYQPFTLGSKETWQTTLSVVYKPQFDSSKGWLSP